MMLAEEWDADLANVNLRLKEMSLLLVELRFWGEHHLEADVLYFLLSKIGKQRASVNIVRNS